MRQGLGRSEHHRSTAPCRKGVSSFPDKPAAFWMLGTTPWLLRKDKGAQKSVLAPNKSSSSFFQHLFLQSLLTFISRTFLSRALSILHSSVMHLSRLVALRWYSSSYCFWLSCQGETRLGEEPETQPHCDREGVLL